MLFTLFESDLYVQLFQMSCYKHIFWCSTVSYSYESACAILFYQLLLKTNDTVYDKDGGAHFPYSKIYFWGHHQVLCRKLKNQHDTNGGNLDQNNMTGHQQLLKHIMSLFSSQLWKANAWKANSWKANAWNK